jgi:hypothetical protein
MAWLAYDLMLPQSPKTSELASLMGWSVDETVGRMLRFWGWCVYFAPDGDLRPLKAGRIAEACGLPAAEGARLMEALQTSDWVETHPYLRMKEWWQIAGMFLRGHFSKTPERWHAIRDLYLPRKAKTSQAELPLMPDTDQVETCSVPDLDQVCVREEKTRGEETRSDERRQNPPPPRPKDDEEDLGQLRREVLERTRLKALSPSDEREIVRLGRTYGPRAVETARYLHSGIDNAVGYLRVALEGRAGPDPELERLKRLAHERGLN